MPGDNEISHEGKKKKIDIMKLLHEKKYVLLSAQKKQYKQASSTAKLVPCSDNVENKRLSLEKCCGSIIDLFLKHPNRA